MSYDTPTEAMSYYNKDMERRRQRMKEFAKWVVLVLSLSMGIYAVVATRPGKSVTEQEAVSTVSPTIKSSNYTIIADSTSRNPIIKLQDGCNDLYISGAAIIDGQVSGNRDTRISAVRSERCDVSK